MSKKNVITTQSAPTTGSVNFLFLLQNLRVECFGTYVSDEKGNKVPDGLATAKFPGGKMSYHGLWQKGEWHGKGKLTIESSNHPIAEYSGEFVHGVMNGECEALYRNGDRFIGVFLNGLPARGKMFYANHNIYEGSFDEKGLKHDDRATLVDGKTGDVSTAKFIHGSLSEKPQSQNRKVETPLTLLARKQAALLELEREAKTGAKALQSQGLDELKNLFEQANQPRRNLELQKSLTEQMFDLADKRNITKERLLIEQEERAEIDKIRSSFLAGKKSAQEQTANRLRQEQSKRDKTIKEIKKRITGLSAEEELARNALMTEFSSSPITKTIEEISLEIERHKGVMKNLSNPDAKNRDTRLYNEKVTHAAEMIEILNIAETEARQLKTAAAVATDTMSNRDEVNPKPPAQSVQHPIIAASKKALSKTPSAKR